MDLSKVILLSCPFCSFNFVIPRDVPPGKMGRCARCSNLSMLQKTPGGEFYMRKLNNEERKKFEAEFGKVGGDPLTSLLGALLSPLLGGPAIDVKAHVITMRPGQTPEEAIAEAIASGRLDPGEDCGDPDCEVHKLAKKLKEEKEEKGKKQESKKQEPSIPPFPGFPKGSGFVKGDPRLN